MVLVTIWGIPGSTGLNFPSISGYAFNQPAMALGWCKLTLRTDILHLHRTLQRLPDRHQAHLLVPILQGVVNTKNAQGCHLRPGLSCHVVYLAAAHRHLLLHTDRNILAWRGCYRRKVHAQLALLVYQCGRQHYYGRHDLHHPPTGPGKS